MNEMCFHNKYLDFYKLHRRGQNSLLLTPSIKLGQGPSHKIVALFLNIK